MHYIPIFVSCKNYKNINEFIIILFIYIYKCIYNKNIIKNKNLNK